LTVEGAFRCDFRVLSEVKREVGTEIVESSVSARLRVIRRARECLKGSDEEEAKERSGRCYQKGEEMEMRGGRSTKGRAGLLQSMVESLFCAGC
jgi:hypothetical protein